MPGFGLGIGFGKNGSRRRRIGAAFPASLFGAGDQGFAFDFSDKTKLFQLSNGTTAVVNNTDPIGYAADLSGKGNHAIQATAGLRPLFGGGAYAQFDGVDDFLATGSIALGTPTLSIVVAVEIPNATGEVVANVAGAGGAAGGFRIQSNSGVASNAPLQPTIYDGTNTDGVHETSPAAAPRTKVYTALLDTSQATLAAEIILRVNAIVAGLTTDSAGPLATTNFATGAVTLGALTGSTLPLAAKIYRVILINRILSGAEIAAAETWAGVPAGISL